MYLRARICYLRREWLRVFSFYSTDKSIYFIRIFRTFENLRLYCSLRESFWDTERYGLAYTRVRRLLITLYDKATQCYHHCVSFVVDRFAEMYAHFFQLTVAGTEPTSKRTVYDLGSREKKPLIYYFYFHETSFLTIPPRPKSRIFLRRRVTKTFV